MRYLRACIAAATVLAAAGLNVAAGQVGTASWQRVLVGLALGALACALLCFAAPALALGEPEIGCGLFMPAVILVVATSIFAGGDLEAHRGVWTDVVVLDKDCQLDDSGNCDYRYRVSDARTEHDFGWVYCDKAELSAGSSARLHTDPKGHLEPNLEACARTSGGWRIALYVALGIYGLIALFTFGLTVQENY
ncbi:hypothetical protein [Dactylosporangium sp. CA-092794]|uniref:hypothetical protein n=1 Tax=Dactylosporangium sp. CA-092794 TaxID=3239929 RepID=UPI003D92ACDE